MLVRDLKDNIDAAISLNPAAGTASRTGSGVDLQGYDSAMAIVQVGAWTDGTHTAKLQESTDNTTYTDVSASNQQGTFTAVSGTAGQNVVQRVGYIGTSRYVRVFVTVAGATTGALSTATIVRGNPNRQPLP